MTGNGGKWKGSTTFSNNDLFRVAKDRIYLCNLAQSLYLTSSSKCFSYSTRKTHCGQDRFSNTSRFPVIEIILNGPFMFVDSDILEIESKIHLQATYSNLCYFNFCSFDLQGWPPSRCSLRSWLADV